MCGAQNSLSLDVLLTPLFQKLLLTLMDLASEFLGKSDSLCNELNVKILHAQGDLRLTLTNVKRNSLILQSSSPLAMKDDGETLLEKVCLFLLA